MTLPTITVETTEERTVFHLSGSLVTESLDAIDRDFARIAPATGEAHIDLSGLDALDTGGAWLIVRLRQRLAREGVTLRLDGASEDRLRFIETITSAPMDAEAEEAKTRGLRQSVEALGARVVRGTSAAALLASFLGVVVSRFLATLLHPGKLRVTALFAQMQQTGMNAVPIIALMGFLIGIVLAYQGAAQLRQFGAEVFVVDLIAVSVLRELGILLTAIIVAGRSGSAFAAAIGSMKVNEEIYAMRTLGLDPVDVLVLPRVIALTLMLPVLGLVANVSALIGGGLMSWIELGVSPGMFVTRFYDNTDVWHLAVGMIKAPFFAFIISVIACWQGLQVGGSAESVGQRTTASVVQSIFFVIVMDAVFSVFFAELGI